MKILSRFKDYYDYLAHQYGVDEKVIFKRDLLSTKPDTTYGVTKIAFKLKNVPYTRNFWSVEKPYSTDILVVNGRGFIIYGKNGFRFKGFSKIYFAGQDIDLDKQLKTNIGYFSTRSRNYVDFDIPDIDEKDLLKIIKTDMEAFLLQKIDREPMIIPMVLEV